MPQWVLFAILAAFFAGLTSVFGKFGINRINADAGLWIRTVVVFFWTSILILPSKAYREIPLIGKRDLLFLILSATATCLSWIFYYRAMKDGLLSRVAAIDKASILVTIIFSLILFKEPLTLKLALGAGLIVAGTFVLLK